MTYIECGDCCVNTHCYKCGAGPSMEDDDVKLTRPMMNREAVAVEVLRSALAWEPNACLLGNVMASEIAALAASAIDTCPTCGSTAWVNNDCDVCMIVASLMNGEMRRLKP